MDLREERERLDVAGIVDRILDLSRRPRRARPRRPWSSRSSRLLLDERALESRDSGIATLERVGC